MRPIFITATNTNVGKTYATLKLIEGFSKAGVCVGVCKPIETGVAKSPQDAQKLLEKCQEFNTNFIDMSPHDVTSYTFELPAAPYCADMEGSIKIENLKKTCSELRKMCDLLLIEGAGGMKVPIMRDYNMLDLAKDLGARILLVTPSHLGCINETVLSLEAGDKYKLDLEWCVNLRNNSREFELTTQPYYDHVFPDWWSLQSGLNGYVERIINAH